MTMENNDDNFEIWPYLVELTGGNIEEASPHPDGGWRFEATQVNKSSFEILEDQDGVDYHFIEITNNDDYGEYVETILIHKKNALNGHDVIIEYLYTKKLDGNHHIDARVEGSILIDPENWDEGMRMMGRRFTDRTFECFVPQVSYFKDALNSIIEQHKGYEKVVDPRQVEKIREEIGEINRLYLKLEGLACSSTS